MCDTGVAMELCSRLNTPIDIEQSTVLSKSCLLYTCSQRCAEDGNDGNPRVSQVWVKMLREYRGRWI